MVPVRWRFRGVVVTVAAAMLNAGGRARGGPVSLEPNSFRSLFVEAYAAAPFDPAGPPPAPNLQNKPFTAAGRVNDSISATQSFRGDDGFRSDAAASVSLDGVLGPELITASVRLSVNSSYSGPDSSVLPPPAEAVAQTHAATRVFVTEPVRVTLDLTADLPDNVIFSPTNQELGRRDAHVEIRQNERVGGDLLLGIAIDTPGLTTRHASGTLLPGDYWLVYVFRIDDLAHGDEAYEATAELRAALEAVTIPLPPALPAAAAAVPSLWLALRLTARRREPRGRR
jgi:hypothetical protein